MGKRLTYETTWGQVRAQLQRLPWRQMAGIFCILLVGLCFWLDLTQDRLADKMLRLHVLANSDTAEDQAIKLQVRDQILREAGSILEGTTDVHAVKGSLSQNLQQLQQAAERVLAQEGYAYPVRVELEKTWFPTRSYEGFALPAGEYEALRVLIGEGAGRNWWCVVFPPLCVDSSTERIEQAAEDAGLRSKEVFLILEDEKAYEIKFRAVELWEQLKEYFA